MSLSRSLRVLNKVISLLIYSFQYILLLRICTVLQTLNNGVKSHSSNNNNRYLKIAIVEHLYSFIKKTPQKNTNTNSLGRPRASDFLLNCKKQVTLIICIISDNLLINLIPATSGFFLYKFRIIFGATTIAGCDV